MQRWVLVFAAARSYFFSSYGSVFAVKHWSVKLFFFLKYLFVFSEAFSRRQSAQLSQTCNVFFNRLWACANDLWPTFGLCPAWHHFVALPVRSSGCTCLLWHISRDSRFSTRNILQHRRVRVDPVDTGQHEPIPRSLSHCCFFLMACLSSQCVHFHTHLHMNTHLMYAGKLYCFFLYTTTTICSHLLFSALKSGSVVAQWVFRESRQADQTCNCWWVCLYA